jgi:hypothetical protein
MATLYGQKGGVWDSVVNNITNQLLVFPHEKIYLHTDKPYYITGEKIFFRAFLLDALSNKSAISSRYIYVELINPADSVVNRLKIRPDENYLFHGAIPLPEELPQGVYKIRAYTQYMRNQGESSFFSKQLRISDPQILSVQTQTDFQFAEEGKIHASLRFMDAKTQKIIQPQSVIMRLNQERTFTGKPDKEGWIRVKLTIPAKASTRVLYVELKENRHVVQQYLRIPYPEGDFDVSFYPEGGHLIAEQMSNVAFKAVNTGGAALDIKGEITDSKGNIVTEFKTFYDGMGEFFFSPQLDEQYQAVCRNGDRTLRFDLPKVQTNTCALKTAMRDDRLWITVNKYDLTSCPELYLLIHCGGLIAYAEAWDTSKDFIAFDASAFPSGINHILLLTKDLQIVSERLVFRLNNDLGFAVFQTQKDTYRKREQIQAGIQLKDGEQSPLKGNFSIAVTNDREVIADTASGILSGILLRSELKGNIENPEYYFQKGNKDAELAADLLMKTHGWTRYAIPEVIRGELSYPKIPFEMSQQFSGIVKSGILSKPAKNFKVSLISLNPEFFDQTETDENGRYLFWNFEFPDSTKYVIQALNSKGKGRQMTELFVDEDTFPGIHTAWIESPVQEERSNPVFLDYVAKADLQYTYENGMRIIHLPEVQVRGIRKDKNKYQSIYYSEPDYSFSSEELQKYGSPDITTLLYCIPGASVSGNSIQLRSMYPPPLILIDDVPMMPMEGESVMDILRMINIHDIGQLDIIKNLVNAAAYGPKASGGAIVIYTKRGEIYSPIPWYNIKSLIPLGYQPPVEFYSPKYDSQESIENSKPDLRTTIFWEPNVLTDDEGKASLDFYTADDPATYTVIIEGVSDDGRLIHYRGNASITVQ